MWGWPSLLAVSLGAQWERGDGDPPAFITVLPPFHPSPPSPIFSPFRFGAFSWVGCSGTPPLLQGWDLPRPHRTSELRLGGPFLPAVDVGAGGGGAVGAEPPIPTPGSECSPPPGPLLLQPSWHQRGGGGRMARSRRFPFFGGGVLGCAGRCLRPGCVGRAVPVRGAVCVCVGGDTPGWGSGGAARGVCGTSWPRGGGAVPRRKPSLCPADSAGGRRGPGRGSGCSPPTPHPRPPAHSSRCSLRRGPRRGRLRPGRQHTAVRGGGGALSTARTPEVGVCAWGGVCVTPPPQQEPSNHIQHRAENPLRLSPNL